jgi:hypothetical protein
VKKTVYIAWGGSSHDWHIVGIYSTDELAREALERKKEHCGFTDEYILDEDET